MPKKKKTIAPTDFFDLKERVQKDKKVKQSDVFGKGKKDDKQSNNKKKDDKKKKPKTKSKNKTTKKKSSY